MGFRIAFAFDETMRAKVESSPGGGQPHDPLVGTGYSCPKISSPLFLCTIEGLRGGPSYSTTVSPGDFTPTDIS